MTKSNITVSVDSEVLEAMRRSGENISEICNHALAQFVGHKERILIDILEPEDRLELLNTMIQWCKRRPHNLEVFARQIREDLGYNAKADEIKDLIDQFWGDDPLD